MTTMLVTLGIITVVCGVLGAIVGAEDGDPAEIAAGLLGGLWLGLCTSSFVGFWWIVIHFVGKYW